MIKRSLHFLLFLSLAAFSSKVSGVPPRVSRPFYGDDTITLSRLMQNAQPMQQMIFKKVKDTVLKVYYVKPASAKPGKKYPAVVCIHGGGWTAGGADVFFPHARYFASRNAVGISIEYRLIKYKGPTMQDCLADCKSAMRFIRAHAAELNIDPDKIVVMGDSAGGHLAASLGTIDGFDDLADNLKISTKPNAMVLYNPGLDMTETPHVLNIIKTQTALGKDLNANLALLTNKDILTARALSPVFHVHPNQPPVLLMHGLDDKVIFPEQSTRFADSMKMAGNQCKLILLPNTRHAFVVTKYTATEATVVNAITEADVFLSSLGFLHGNPTLRLSDPPAWVIKAPAKK